MIACPHYLAVPSAGTGPGVLVLHSWWGLNDFFRSLCDRLAAAGFVALAPDLYDGRVARTPADAKRLRAESTAARRVPVYRTLMSAVGQLATRGAAPGGRPVTLWGASMGGHWALWLAQQPELPVASAVVFYAARNGDFTRSRCRFLFHFAESDDWGSAASVWKMRTSLGAAARPASYHEYPGTTHWFFEQDRPEAFDGAAAALAWERSLAFLRAGPG